MGDGRRALQCQGAERGREEGGQRNQGSRGGRSPRHKEAQAEFTHRWSRAVHRTLHARPNEYIGIPPAERRPGEPHQQFLGPSAPSSRVELR